MPDNVPQDPAEVLRQILSMMYSIFLQNQALQWALVRKGVLTADEIDKQYQTLSDAPELRAFREKQGITDSELFAVLSRQLRSFQGTIQ